jgi:biopolymer transport protein ExbD
MRTGALALLLLMASCGQGDRVSQANRAEAVPDVSGPRSGTRAAPPVTITIAARGPGGCAASWDGQQVTPEQIRERGYTLVRQAVVAAGGAQNLTEDTIPILDVEAPADLSFACADTILASIERTGMISVRLKPAGGRAPVLVDFPLDMGAPPPIPMVLGIGAGGQVTWNNDPIDAAALAARLGYHGSTAPPAPGEVEAPLELRVAREATFGQVYELLRTTRRYHLRPFLYLPSAEAGAEQPAPPPPPPPPPR